MKLTKVFEPGKIGNLELKNRLVVSAMSSHMGNPDGTPNEAVNAYLVAKVKGGWGLVFTEDLGVTKDAGSDPVVGSLWSDDQVPAWTETVRQVHAAGGLMGAQIYHAGRQRSLKAYDTHPVAPSALKEPTEPYVPRALTVEEIHDLVKAFGEAAARAKRCGFDCVEIHGAHGYLINQFMSTFSNKRTDEYGGTLANRMRFALEVIAAVREAVGADYPIIFRFNTCDYVEGGIELPEAIVMAKMLEEAGVDMIQVAQANHTGNMGDTIPPMGDVDYNWTLPAARAVKKAVSVPVATVGRVISLEAGEKILEDQDADIVAYGRSMLADPDIANKAASGECIRECLNCNKGCVDAIQGRRYISCVLNAENGNEGTVFIKPAEKIKNIAVVGAGIAGLEAARVAAKRGHHVTVYEKSDKIGGQIHLAAVPPRKSEILRAVTYYEKILPQLNVNIKLNTEAEAEELNQYDAVILAVGAHNMALPMPVENSNVVSAWEVLAGKEVQGSCVVLGGGLVGTETAEYLAQKGVKVSIVEMMDKIAAGESSTVMPLIVKDFEKHEVAQYIQTKVVSIKNNVIEAVHTPDEAPVELKADTIINALGSKKNIFDDAKLTVPFTYVGDCSGEKTADIASAIRTGYHAANEL